MQTLWQDVRYGFRTLVKSPGFTVFAVAVLALGIAANTAIFSLADAVLLRPLPYRDASGLVMVWEDASFVGFPHNTPAPGNFSDWKAQNHVFEDMAAIRETSFNLTGDSGPEELPAHRVTANLFSVLGARPALGRAFLPEDDRPGAAHVVLLSRGLWLRRFGADPQIVGREIPLDGATYTVVGVMPRGFQFPDRETEMWVPVQMNSQELTNHDSHYLNVVARLKPGVTLSQANADLAVIAERLARQYPGSNANLGAFATSLRAELAGNLRLAILVLLGAVGFVLLIACANVANLQLARAAGRQRELALRMALGASQSRIIWQLLIESVLLASLAGGLGLLLSVWGMAFLKRLIPTGIPQAAGTALDARVLGFTLLVSVATGVLFGIAPALRVRRLSLNESLKQGGRTSAGLSGGRTRDALVVAEVALALMLLTGAGLMIESFAKLRKLDPGFQAEHVLALRTPLPKPRYADFAKRSAFYDQVLERVSHLSGVVSAGCTTWLPLTNRGGASGITIEGRPQHPPGESDVPNTRMISKDYFRTLDVPLKQGRMFDDRDGAQTPLVAVINETAAWQFWPSENPLGKRFKFGDYANHEPWITIVGVVGDVHQMGLDVPARAEIYLPYQQQDSFEPGYLAVKTAGDPMQLAQAVREQVWAVDKEQPVSGVMPLQELLDEELSPRQTQADVLGAFAGLALLLASLGIYAVLSFRVAQRTQEIGVRMALGAQRGDVLQMVLRQGLKLTLLGIAVGLAGALALSRVLAHLLYGVSATDPATFAGVAALLVAVALLACYIPARRAMRVDPMVALRYE